MLLNEYHDAVSGTDPAADDDGDLDDFLNSLTDGAGPAPSAAEGDSIDDEDLDKMLA